MLEGCDKRSKPRDRVINSGCYTGIRLRNSVHNRRGLVRAHLSRTLDVEDLASAAAMSPRTFIRQFKAQFKTTRVRWVQSLRVESCDAATSQRSQYIVKQTRPITGLRDEQTLRRALIQQIGVTPKECREHFGELGRDHGTYSGGSFETGADCRTDAKP